MPTNRFQFSDDFVLNANKVGINTATPQEKLDVVGIVKGDNLKVTGVSSFTSYEGFLNSNHNITENTTLTSGTSGSLSGEIIVGTDITLSGISSTTSGQGHIDSLKVYNTLTIPVGGTLERPSKSKPGQLYYNKDFSTIEFYTGEVWRQVDNTTQSGRGVFGGGNIAAGDVYSIDYINIATTGNSLDFGTIASSVSRKAGCSDSTRGLLGGGVASNVIDYLTIASSGNTIDFGDLTAGRYAFSACSSSTRGIFGGGYTVPTGSRNIIDYVQISTIGNALDFGDLTAARFGVFSCSSSTRGIFGGGTPGNNKTIEFITISSTGNAVRFGNLNDLKNYGSACSSSTRGIIGGGGAPYNMTEYINISSTGNSTEFGDLTIARETGSNAVSNSVRGVFGSGYGAPAYYNVIDYITITSLGNALDFGDMSKTLTYYGALSDSHGGLGGF